MRRRAGLYRSFYEALQRACMVHHRTGGMKAVAAALKVNPRTISNWLSQRTTPSVAQQAEIIAEYPQNLSTKSERNVMKGKGLK